MVCSEGPCLCEPFLVGVMVFCIKKKLRFVIITTNRNDLVCYRENYFLVNSMLCFSINFLRLMSA